MMYAYTPVRKSTYAMISRHTVGYHALGCLDSMLTAVKMIFRTTNMIMYRLCPAVGTFPSRYGSGRTWYVPNMLGQTRYGRSLLTKAEMPGKQASIVRSIGAAKPVTSIAILFDICQHCCTLVVGMSYPYPFSTVTSRWMLYKMLYCAVYTYGETNDVLFRWVSALVS